MDPIRILKRAWHILWQYRALWIFGLIIALTVGGSSGGGNSSSIRNNLNDTDQQYTMPSMDTFPGTLSDAWTILEKSLKEGISSVDWLKDNWTPILWITGIFVLVMLLIGIVLTIARYVSETSVIRMVDEYEATDTKMGVRQGFRLGWSRTSWRLFLIDLIISIPSILLLIGLVIIGVIMYNIATVNSNPFEVPGFVIMIFAIILILFLIVILNIILDLFRAFFWRVCALENVGVMESLRRGFKLVLKNWKNVGLMWLIMIGVGIVWMIGSFIAIILLIPVVLITAVLAVIVAGIPAFLLAGIFSIFLTGPLHWIAAGVFILPLFFTLAFLPWIMVGAWKIIFDSAVWTLTYREIKALPVLAPANAVSTVNA
jgi:hypothetical protein